VFHALTVGGGIRAVEDMFVMLRAGADKVSINSAALAQPDLIRAGAREVREPVHCGGDRCETGGAGPLEVFSQGGRKPTGVEAVEWPPGPWASGRGDSS